jgi:hypothetical protein
MRLRWIGLRTWWASGKESGGHVLWEGCEVAAQSWRVCWWTANCFLNSIFSTWYLGFWEVDSVFVMEFDPRGAKPKGVHTGTANWSLWWYGLNTKEAWHSFDATFDIVIDFAKERSYARPWRSSLWERMAFDKSYSCEDLSILLQSDLPVFRFSGIRSQNISECISGQWSEWRPALFDGAVDVSPRDVGLFQHYLVGLEVTTGWRECALTLEWRW